MAKLFTIAVLLILSGCSQKPADSNRTEATMEVDTEKLSTILSNQAEETKARYQYRHPQETLTYFGIAPGMTVVEILPGGGWYSQILVPYLGNKSTLIGIDYAADMWPNFSFATAEFLQSRKEWPEKWTTDAKTWANGNGANTSAFTFKTIPQSMTETADAILFIRALHNLARFEHKGGFLTQALNESYRILKPGGIAGVVQHRAPDSKSDEWSSGARGYLKPSFVIAKMEQAGFEYIGASEINANARDLPGDEDIVWRLPPSLYTSKDNQELQNRYLAIGESDRMTLKFRKPAK